MNIIILAQVIATLLFVITLAYITYFAARGLHLRRLFKTEYIKYIQTKHVRRLYPLVPRPGSKKYISTKHFLISVGWKMSVEHIYLCKWGLFSILLFLLVTMQTTNSNIAINKIIEDVNYHKNIIEPSKEASTASINLEKQLYLAVSETFHEDSEPNKEKYINRIKEMLIDRESELGEDMNITAQRLYHKVLQTRLLKSNLVPYVYILLISMLMYNLPDILGQIKRKLIEDKKNWEVLNCFIVYSIFARMPPYSVIHILEHMIIATEVYKPLFEELLEGIKKGGDPKTAFESALQVVDRDELYELIETMKLAKNTGFNASVRDVDETITNTIKWIEIENITRRKIKMLYAMTAVAAVMGLGFIYFAYGLTIISNPANFIMK